MDDLHNDLAAHVADELASADDDLEAQVDDEIADEMTREFFGEPADGGQLAALSEARLAEILNLTADVVAGRIHVRFDEESAWLAILDLRREALWRREHEAALLAERAALREIAQTVTRGFTLVYSDLSDAYYCALCHAELPTLPDVDLFGDWTRIGWREQHIQHTADCPVTKARAALAAETGKE